MNETIKALREKNGFSQSYLASYLDVSRQMYIKYENGEVEPPIKAVKALCRLYSVPYSTIIDNELKPQASIMAAEAAPPYMASMSDFIADKIQLLSIENYNTVVSFINFLINEEEKPRIQSKKAFFDLEGKIDLDTKSVEEFREGSLI